MAGLTAAELAKIRKLLRRESGAAISKKELEAAKKGLKKKRRSI